MSGELQFFYEAGHRHTDISSLECFPTQDPPAEDLIIDWKRCNLTYVFFNQGTLVFLIFIISILLRECKILKNIIFWIPQSVIVLLFGLTVGFIATAAGASLKWINITQSWVKFGFLPPIILNSAYTLYHKNFFNQFVSVILLAVFGTITAINGITIFLKLGNLLHGIDKEEPSMWDYYKFGTTVSSVDPITVLSIFNTANVDSNLYFLVFGESAFNDGVAYALFKGFKKVDDWVFIQSNATGSAAEVETETYLYLTFSFIVGPILSILFAFIIIVASSLITKISTNNSQLFTPFFVLGCVWTGFYISDFIGLSPIIFTLVCGLGQIRYTFPNLSPAKQLTIRLVLKTIATVYQMCIFLFLGVGVSAVDFAGYWRIIIITTLIMYFWRCVVIVFASFLINKYGRTKIHWKWQIILCVGSLRGILAITMSKENDGEETLFQDICLALIFITVCINGIAIKPLVYKLRLREKTSPENIKDVLEAEATAIHKTMHSILEGSIESKWKQTIKSFERKYVQRFLCKSEKEKYMLLTTFQTQTILEKANHFFHIAEEPEQLDNPKYLSKKIEKKDNKTTSLEMEDNFIPHKYEELGNNFNNELEALEVRNMQEENLRFLSRKELEDLVKRMYKMKKDE